MASWAVVGCDDVGSGGEQVTVTAGESDRGVLGCEGRVSLQIYNTYSTKSTTKRHWQNNMQMHHDARLSISQKPKVSDSSFLDWVMQLVG